MYTQEGHDLLEIENGFNMWICTMYTMYTMIGGRMGINRDDEQVWTIKLRCIKCGWGLSLLATGFDQRYDSRALSSVPFVQ